MAWVWTTATAVLTLWMQVRVHQPVLLLLDVRYVVSHPYLFLQAAYYGAVVMDSCCRWAPADMSTVRSCVACL